MPDVYFVNPPSPDGAVYIRDLNRSGRRSREHMIWPQMSLALLAAVARDAGFSVGLIDCIADKVGWKAFEKKLRRLKPRYIMTNAISTSITNDLRVAEIGREFGAKTLSAGPHVTALPEETLKRYPHLDAAIVGEPEETFRETLLALEAGKSLKKIKGLCYRDGDKVVRTPDRPFIENLDDLPVAMHELLPVKNYRMPYIGRRYTFVLANRGCPYPCVFCRQPIMWRRRVRLRSAKSLFNELAYLQRLGIDNVMFHGDTFTIKREIVMELCDMIVSSGMKVRWICNSRVDTVDPGLLGAMKRAGCWMIAYGFESGSDEVLKESRKGGNATVAQAEKAAKWTREAGIMIWGYFVLGLPGENAETVEETIAFSKRVPMDIVNFAVAAPYPGTEFHEMVKSKGYLMSENWEDFDQNYSAIVSYPDFPAEQIRKSIRKAYVSWYLRPYGLKALWKGLGDFQNIMMLARIAWDHVLISREK